MIPMVSNPRSQVLAVLIAGCPAQAVVGDLLLETTPYFATMPTTSISPLPEHNYKTDKDGRFRIEGVAPGVKYNVMTNLPGNPQVVFDASAEPGETKDLGNLPLKPLAVGGQ
jgi:hypothetical protein